MTEEEQEALSRKYLSLHVLPLSSGRFALFDSGYNLLDIHYWGIIRTEVPTIDQLLATNEAGKGYRNFDRPKSRPLPATIDDLI